MKRFVRQLFLLLLCAVLLAGCVSPAVPDATTETNTQGTTEPEQLISDPNYTPDPDDGIYDVGYEELPCSRDELYEQLFDRNNKVTVALDMSDAELLKLQEDYDHYRDMGSKSPIYRMADLLITVGSHTYRIFEVGVRMKGNTSRTSFYSPEEGIYNHIHLKLDFQETFEDAAYYGSDAKVWESKDLRKARKNRTFATLEKLELRWNKCADSTYLKETYAYELYRSEGVLAPRANLCSFAFSGVHMGVYTLNEPVDEVFLSKRLPAEELGGDLYKGGWGATFTNMNSIGIENEDNCEFYAFDLKSNKKTSQHETLKNLITALNFGTVTKESYADVVDVENFLSYAAVSYFLGNPDDLRHNYNNFYLYFLKSSGKAILIPYDYDRCLGVTYEWNPTGNGVTKDNPFADTMAGAEGNEDPIQRNPLFIHSVDKGGYYVREFAAVLERVEKNPLLQSSTFAEYFNTYNAHYAREVMPSKEMKNHGGRSYAFELDSGFGGNLSFDNYITAKMATYRSHMARLEEYASYVRPVEPVFFIRGEFTNWDVQDDYAMWEEDGKLVYDLTFLQTGKFKVYHVTTDEWYGTEAMSADTTVPYDTSGRTNIVLRPGTYRVIFDPGTQLITVTE